MKTLQHYQNSNNETVLFKEESQKQLSINMPTIASLEPTSAAFTHLKDCCCLVCSANSKLFPFADVVKQHTNSNKRTISFTDNRFVQPNELTKPNVDFLLANAVLNKSDSSVLKSKSINYLSNKSQPSQIQHQLSKSHYDNNNSSTNHQLLLSHNENKQNVSSKASWDILCKLINCKVAFKKQYNGKKYNWIQLAGHAGRFLPGDREGFILKIMDDLERKCLELLQQDVLGPYVPSIENLILNKEDGKHYTEMQDLLYSFHNPSIMDIKIGVRTFLEDDSDEKECKPRNDLYLKLVEMAPNEPTKKEHEMKAITKRRYMSWRERSTCSAMFGFRIEAIKKNHVSEKEFYSVKERKEAKNHFKNFVSNKKSTMIMYLNRLNNLKSTLLESKFFYSHELIGSSLLFVHDKNNTGIWMIDFGKTRHLPIGMQITHDRSWQEGNHEDGYLIGIDSLISIFQESIDELI